MNKFLPAPRLSLFLLIFWLLIQNSVTPGLLVLGIILAFAIPLYTSRGSDFHVRVARPFKALEYCFIVVVDIVISNFSIAAIILSPRRRIYPAWVEYPLNLEGELPITILASTISLTPGTISTEFSHDGRTLLIHSLNVSDADAMIAKIRQRYENRLKVIFQC
jgi:multicomponent K+:H+ antiporter subunit E